MEVLSLDHLVLTVRDVRATCAFYTSVLGIKEITFDDGRKALRFGDQKVNLHQAGDEIAPHARTPTPGSADLCFLTNSTVEETIAYLAANGVAPELGPVARTGATGPIMSIYLRDPDGNLIELACRTA